MNRAASLASLSLVLAALAPLSAASAATILTFEGAGPDDLPVDGGYGDNLPTTPDVSLDFTNLSVYSGDFGSGFTNSEVYVTGGNAVITFTAASGARVRLDSFDVGTYGGVGDEFSYSYSIDGGPAVAGTATGVAAGSPVTVQLSDVLSAVNGTITLTVNLVGEYDPVLDNVTFSQLPEIPEPAAALAMLVGLPLLVRRGSTSR